MSTQEQFKDAADVAAHLAQDPGIAEEVRSEINASELLSTMISLRISKNLTQEDIAKSIDCDPSTVSRIESGSGRELKWSHIMGYMSAMPEVQMSILFDDQSLPPAARIKQFVFKIDEDLKRLVEIAQRCDGDDTVSRKIDKFYREVLINFLLRYSENRDRLKNFVSIRPKETPALPKLTHQTEATNHSETPEPPSPAAQH